MSFGQFRSLQVRLAVRLAVLYVAAAAIAVGVLVYQVYDTAGSLNDRELGLPALDRLAGLAAGDLDQDHPHRLMGGCRDGDDNRQHATRDQR